MKKFVIPKARAEEKRRRLGKEKQIRRRLRRRGRP